MLLRFRDTLGNNGRINNWDGDTEPCPMKDDGNSTWVGVLCSNGTVWGLQLENMNLTGPLYLNALMGLPGLRTLSFKHNQLYGALPDFSRLSGLKSIYLSDNRLSGEISTNTFEGMGWLKKLHLSRNSLSGTIPHSLTTLPRLFELRLDNNQFVGKMPEFNQPGLKLVNVSNNQLEGPIPQELSKMDASCFEGNYYLCGDPLDVSCRSSSKKALLVFLIVVAILILLAIIGLIVVLLHRRRREDSSKIDSIGPMINNKITPYEGNPHNYRGSPESAITEKKGGKDHNQGKLLFLRDDTERFDLQDLLRASAEVLGSGSFGSSYKAVLMSGAAMVVKRFKEMNGVGREDFQEHMRRLGRLKHPNLLSIVAFYYRKEEKLLVTDFLDNGSLVQLLHGNRSPDRPSLDWPIRLKIIKGVARGLAFLYTELPILTLPHGHLKSSNVLLNDSFEPVLTDYALAPIMNKDHSTQLMVAYKSPEFLEHGQITKKSDVWSLGVLILEILTGKFPANYLGQGKGVMDLAAWVNSVMVKEGTGELFDSDMERTSDCEGEMLKLLKIGLACCEEKVEKRFDLNEALKRIEELKEKDSGKHGKISVASEEDMYSTTEDFSLS